MPNVIKDMVDTILLSTPVITEEFIVSGLKLLRGLILDYTIYNHEFGYEFNIKYGINKPDIENPDNTIFIKLIDHNTLKVCTLNTSQKCFTELLYDVAIPKFFGVFPKDDISIYNSYYGYNLSTEKIHDVKEEKNDEYEDKEKIGDVFNEFTEFYYHTKHFSFNTRMNIESDDKKLSSAINRIYRLLYCPINDSDDADIDDIYLRKYVNCAVQEDCTYKGLDKNTNEMFDLCTLHNENEGCINKVYMKFTVKSRDICYYFFFASEEEFKYCFLPDNGKMDKDKFISNMKDAYHMYMLYQFCVLFVTYKDKAKYFNIKPVASHETGYYYYIEYSIGNANAIYIITVRNHRNSLIIHGRIPTKEELYKMDTVTLYELIKGNMMDIVKYYIQ